MARPGVVVSLRETPGALSFPTDTGNWFVIGTTERGPSYTPMAISSLAEFVTAFGDRQSYSVLYDALETFFREGGYRAYISRVVGPAATSGFKNLVDNVAAVSLIVTAAGPGAWSANYKVAVVAGTAAGSYKIQITDASNNVLEDSGDLLDQNAAVYWSRLSNYVRITLGASALNPITAAAAALSAGNDDRASITDTQWQTAQDSFGSNLGPGQVSQPGRTSTAAYTALKAHAEANNRVALLDFPNTATVATLQSSATSITSRFCAGFAPWVVIPGTTLGSLRTVPPSALIAGLLARNDDRYGTNHPAAGQAGQANYVTDLSQVDWTDANRQTLNTSGVNVIRRMFGGIRVYGWRSMVNATTDANWLDFANARLFMFLQAELAVAGENFMFEEIDGQNGRTINAFHDAIVGVLQPHFVSGELFGSTAEEAYFVDTGNGVNTLTRLENLELHAIVNVRMSPFAEWIQIEVVKRRVTEGVV